MHTAEDPSFGDTTFESRMVKKPEEHLILLKGIDNSSVTTLPKGSSSTSVSKSEFGKNKRGYIKLDSDKEWDTFFELQNDPSTNTTNKEPFSPKKGESHYHGKEIIGKIADQIKAEISEGLKNHTIGPIMIKEGKREDDIVYPTVRVMLQATKEGIDIPKLLSGSICEKYDVRTVTFCHPNQEKERGACCYINDQKERVYEIISGLYGMTLKWYVDGQECKIKVKIDNKDGVTLLEGNSVSPEQLRGNKEVKIGKRREPKSLYEALASQLQ